MMHKPYHMQATRRRAGRQERSVPPMKLMPAALIFSFIVVIKTF